LIEIHDFVPHDSIDPIVFERSYYLGPADGAEHVYALLARALEKAGLVAIATFVFHDRDQLACLRVRDRALVLERMYFADEIRPLDGVLPERAGRVGDRELKLAIDLIERMKGTFDHDSYHDSYRDALRDIIKRKRKGEKISAPKPVERRGPPDLMDALEASLAAAVERGRAAPKRARARSDGDVAELSREKLLERARRAKVRGRSRMSKRELVAALSDDD
jgi:DNA end-binding protein Ku